MKARLIEFQDTLQLLLHTGKIITISAKEAADFLLNFDNPQYYAGNGTWDYEGVTMESYGGETIAYVNEDGSLCVENAVLFRNVLAKREVNLLTIQEYAALHGKQTGIIRRFCLQDRIPGAFLKGNMWLIPETSPYPSDSRFRK